MAALRSLAFNIGYYVRTAVLMIVGLPIALCPYRAIYWFGRIWVRVILWLLKALIGLEHRVVGLEHRIEGPAIYAVKHQSTWDTLVFALYLRYPAYVVKRELIFLPFFGLFLLRAGMIPVDRAGRGTALKRMMRAAAGRREEGRDILIYPEGTRVAPGV